MSDEQKKYLKKVKKEKITIILIQIFIVLSFIILWQFLADKKIINTFIFSSPKKVIETFINLYKNYNLTTHIITTLYETIIAFSLGISLLLILS